MKVSVELNRSATVNAGNYNTIRPNVTIRIDDIEESQVISKSSILSELLDAMFAKEFIALSGEVNTMSNVGFQNYSKALEGQEELINEKIDKLYKQLLK